MLQKCLLHTLAIILLGAGLAHASMDSYLETLRISATADFGDYRAGLGAHYGASGAVLDQVFLAVNDPGEAAVCFWLARTSGQPMNTVLDRYRTHHKKGWGALAQSLGIKPGSAEFKALKAGQLGWYPANKQKGSHGGENGGDDKDHKEKSGHGGKDKGKK